MPRVLTLLVILMCSVGFLNVANAKGGKSMVVITAAWEAKPGKEVALRKELETMVDAVRKNEPNCLEYTLHQGLDANQKATFFFYERYTDRTAIDVHKNTPHFKALIANTESLIAKSVDVKILEAIK